MCTEGRSCVTVNENSPYVLKKLGDSENDMFDMFLYVKLPYSKKEKLEATYILFQCLRSDKGG